MKFYENLYKSQTNVNDEEIDEYLENTFTSTLNDSEANNCEGKFTVDSCYEALQDMKLNKSPGLDGLSVEFYLAFWSQIKHMVTNSLNEGYEKGHLSTSQRQSVYSLIYKKE